MTVTARAQFRRDADVVWDYFGFTREQRRLLWIWADRSERAMLFYRQIAHSLES